MNWREPKTVWLQRAMTTPTRRRITTRRAIGFPPCWWPGSWDLSSSRTLKRMRAHARLRRLISANDHSVTFMVKKSNATRLEQLVEDLLRAHGENLASVVLYGS